MAGYSDLVEKFKKATEVKTKFSKERIKPKP